MTDKLAPQHILDLDAVGLMDAYRAGECTPSQAVEAYIAHQQKVNPILNLVVSERYEQARKEAAHYDSLLMEGKVQGRLFGVPMTGKEALDVKGMPTTGALHAYADKIAHEDAEAVGRVRAQGAIILSKTNTPCLCMCQETDSLLYGKANNPWDPERTTGGSSGGEGGLISVGGAAAGLGADIGGSIRIPSHFNGVVGFMPGAHQSPDKGLVPPIDLPDQRFMLGIGPMVKSVRDAALIYSVIWPEFQIPQTWEAPDNVRVVSFGSFGKTQCSPGTEQILSQAQNALMHSGMEIKTRPLDFLHDATLAWQLTMAQERGGGLKKLAYPHGAGALWGDYLKGKFGMEAQCHHYLSWALIGMTLFGPTEKQIHWLRDLRKTGLERIKGILGDSGVLLTPVLPFPARSHGRFYADLYGGLSRPFRWVLPFIALGNFFGLPSLIVPCGFSDKNLPIALQVSSTVGNEELVMRVGARLEREMGGYQRCRKYD